MDRLRALHKHFRVQAWGSCFDKNRKGSENEQTQGLGRCAILRCFGIAAAVMRIISGRRRTLIHDCIAARAREREIYPRMSRTIGSPMGGLMIGSGLRLTGVLAVNAPAVAPTGAD